MRKKVVRVGTSAGVTLSREDVTLSREDVTLSREELSALGVSVGDSVDVTVRDDVVEIRPVNPFTGMSHEDRVALLDRFGARE